MKKIYPIALLFLFALSFIKAQSTFTYTGKPMYNIDVKRAGIFLGSIHVELYPTVAPHHVRNFDSLVSVHFYDTTAFHRVIPGFVIQGGDPNSRHGATNTWGSGQAGQPTVNAEFSAVKHLRGTLSAARSNNINSATSQFFICVATAASLNGAYSAYGHVISGMNYVDTIVLAPRNSNDLPNLKHEMFITYLGSNDTIPVPPALNTPTNGSIAIDKDVALLLKWNSVRDAILYNIEVADDSTFSFLIKEQETSNLSTYVSSGLLPDTKYYWRVKSNNGGNYSPWSTIWTFDTSSNPVGIVKNTAALGTSVYPNPSQGKFTFANLTIGSKLEIFDATGKRITETSVKENTLIIDLEGKEKGIYFYKISADKETLQGKLILK